jgi:catechol 2,3-dioxygenase-like lactoylglutathione lyase family enzyme
MAPYPVTSIGLLVEDPKPFREYYQEMLGLELQEDLPEFVRFLVPWKQWKDPAGKIRVPDDVVRTDYHPQLPFFLWSRSHFEEHIGMKPDIKNMPSPMIAMQLDSPAEVDVAYEEYRQKGVSFLIEPKNFEFQARATYFMDDNGIIWEFFAWQD